MDTKLKLIGLMTLLLSSFAVNVAMSQVYNVRSLDGENVHFQLEKNDFKRILNIMYANDTIHIRDVEDIQAVRVLNDKFLMIVYQVHAGTGMNAERTLMLSASKHKTIQLLSITSLFHEEFLDFNNHVTSPMQVEINRTYKVYLSLTGDNLKNYKVRATIHDEKLVRHKPKTNYKTKATAILHFDPKENIFCNLNENLAGHFTVFDPETQEESKKYIRGLFSGIRLGSHRYYYINNIWYERSDTHYLTKSSYTTSL